MTGNQRENAPVFDNMVKSQKDKSYIVRLFIFNKLVSQVIYRGIFLVEILIGIIFVCKNSVFIVAGLVLRPQVALV